LHRFLFLHRFVTLYDVLYGSTFTMCCMVQHLLVIPNKLNIDF
jgi:hypothetical protein